MNKANILEPAKIYPQGVALPLISSFHPDLVRKISFTLIFTLTLGSAAIVMLSQGALPGDSLYKVKTDFKERIETVTSFSARGISNTSRKHAIARLEEAKALHLAERLDPAIATYLTQRFADETFRVGENALSMGRSGRAVLAADMVEMFNNDLRISLTVLSKTSADTTELVRVVNNAIAHNKAVDAELMASQFPASGVYAIDNIHSNASGEVTSLR